tara:strand:- start:118 stop:372 length:255 start_codon:yes stop_codon:yes gene_type:complete
MKGENMEDSEKKDPFDTDSLVERIPFDFATARENLKRGCRHCSGKGYLTLHTSTGKGPMYKGGPTQIEQQYCKCVIKNLKKQFK